MSEVNGKLVSCDRCGDTVFLKCIGEKELDGGYTRYNTFEAMPTGWEYHVEVGRLCPTCNEEWNNLVATFKHIVRECEA